MNNWRYGIIMRNINLVYICVLPLKSLSQSLSELYVIGSGAYAEARRGRERHNGYLGLNLLYPALAMNMYSLLSRSLKL